MARWLHKLLNSTIFTIMAPAVNKCITVSGSICPWLPNYIIILLTHSFRSYRRAALELFYLLIWPSQLQWKLRAFTVSMATAAPEMYRLRSEWVQWSVHAGTSASADFQIMFNLWDEKCWELMIIVMFHIYSWHGIGNKLKTCGQDRASPTLVQMMLVGSFLNQRLLPI